MASNKLRSIRHLLAAAALSVTCFAGPRRAARGAGAARPPIKVGKGNRLSGDKGAGAAHRPDVVTMRRSAGAPLRQGKKGGEEC